MNTTKQNKPKLKITAQSIGPIMSIDAALSEEKRNLIFARNGTGKSFIARSLRMLDKAALSEMDTVEIPDLLVSEESDGVGSFALYEDENCIGRIELNTSTKTTSILEPSYIFHVFSEDYVDENLRNKLESLDGNITHEIVVGKDNAELDEKQKLLDETAAKLKEARSDLDAEYVIGKNLHQKKFGIRASLGAFKALTTDIYFQDQTYAPDGSAETLDKLLKQYELFKSIPQETDQPVPFAAPEFVIDMNSIASALQAVTSPSSVARTFRDKIASDPSFFEAGLHKHRAAPDNCPFCTQDMGDVAMTAVDAYAKYFDDKEAQEIKRINRMISNLDSVVLGLDTWLSRYLQNARRYDVLKTYFPSCSSSVVPDPSKIVQGLKSDVASLQSSLREKLNSLSSVLPMPDIAWNKTQASISSLVFEANELIDALNKLVENSDEERKSIQNKSCKAFEITFFGDNKDKIDEIRAFTADIARLSAEVAEIRKSHGDRAQARDRVVETFSLLLGRFFGDRYTFDAESFKVHRKDMEIRRGSDRTLSDGEKAALAFCYFIAQTHLRVASNEDYEKVYFVFDDPVTSMSFDFVYSIIQALKLLRINKDGEIQFNLNSDVHRPKMLILTHNNYFFNVVSTNNVVSKSGLFQLVAGATAHRLVSQKSFATPHLLQLKHVAEVANKTIAPDHTTPNAIRSVVEGMWKFCRPDLTDFDGFLRYLIEQYEIEIKSVLINHFSHHTGFDMLPDSEDISLAASEALRVVEILASGQLKNVQS
ncbi:AAA family ATPase [Roseibium sp.]|uniref:AAA family ATPase n=1 Tax=Roseibium sp. TaxID=1936156 RepID=UPI00329911D5